VHGAHEYCVTRYWNVSGEFSGRLGSQSSVPDVFLDERDYNIAMFVRLSFTRTLVAAGLLAATLGMVSQAQDAPKRGRKYKEPPATSRVEITVTRATNGKPVENAAVIFHPLSNGRDNGNMELKTNDEGKAVIDVLEVGSSVRLQIIAHGFQTYGEDYKVDKDTMAIAVKLKRPAEQYSIYKKSEGNETDKNKPAEKDQPADSPDAAKPDQAKPDTAKPQDPASRPDAPPQDAPKPQNPPSSK
jgi:hypothetical protein